MNLKALPVSDQLHKATRPYWYKIHVGECPVCGRDKGYRERVYGEKPQDVRARYHFLPDTETYDHCNL